MYRKFMKVSCIILTLLISSFGIIGCSKNAQTVENKKTGVEKRYLNIDYRRFKDDKELLDRADVVVLGKVIKTYEPKKININQDQNSEPVENVYTVCDLKVEKVIKGDIEAGQVVQIKQNGGLFENVEYIYGEQEYLKENMDYVVFLESYIKLNPQMPYSLLNPTQGSKPAKDKAEKDKLINDLEKIKDIKATN